MTRLNNRIRKQIEDNAVIKAGIVDKKAKLRERRAMWIEAVRIQAIGGQEVEDRIKAVKKKIKTALKDLPESLIVGSVFREGFDIRLNVAGCTAYGYFNGADKDSGDGPRVTKIAPSSHTLLQGDPLVDEFHAIESEKSDLESQEVGIRASVAGAVSKVGTVKRLLEVWPEAKELLPDDLSPVKKQLPAVKAEDLNAMIGLPSDGK